MNKLKIIFLPLAFIILSIAAIIGSYWSLLMFPAVAFLFFFLVKGEAIKPEIKTVITGVAIFIIFSSWHLIRYNNLYFQFLLIYVFGVMAAIEGWRFTLINKNSLWGLMNLVILWIAMDYLLYLWLPFDISGWFLGTPLILFEETANPWLLYMGKQGFTLWVLTGGLLLFKGVDFLQKGINLLTIIAAVTLIAVPILISPETEGASQYYAQGEWIGRTCIWLSVLLLAYSFVKRKTNK